MILRAFFPKACSMTPPTIKHKRVSVAIVCTPPPHLSSGGGVGWRVESPTKFSKREGLDRISIFRGWLLIKRAVSFFKRGAVFT